MVLSFIMVLTKVWPRLAPLVVHDFATKAAYESLEALPTSENFESIFSSDLNQPFAKWEGWGNSKLMHLFRVGVNGNRAGFGPHSSKIPDVLIDCGKRSCQKTFIGMLEKAHSLPNASANFLPISELRLDEEVVGGTG